ncbi:MAG: hypothetical protein IJ848_02495, partial [Alphaproteobacteria bacterium]|nr:hypothetical protein [Alphaproteobacteria bacterium]
KLNTALTELVNDTTQYESVLSDTNEILSSNTNFTNLKTTIESNKEKELIEKLNTAISGLSVDGYTSNISKESDITTNNLNTLKNTIESNKENEIISTLNTEFENITIGTTKYPATINCISETEDGKVNFVTELNNFKNAIENNNKYTVIQQLLNEYVKILGYNPIKPIMIDKSYSPSITNFSCNIYNTISTQNTSSGEVIVLCNGKYLFLLTSTTSCKDIDNYILQNMPSLSKYFKCEILDVQLIWNNASFKGTITKKEDNKLDITFSDPIGTLSFNDYYTTTQQDVASKLSTLSGNKTIALSFSIGVLSKIVKTYSIAKTSDLLTVSNDDDSQEKYTIDTSKPINEIVINTLLQFSNINT